MKRLTSLDVFRGVVIAGMILVNCPGSDDVYAPLKHADWHGCTPADLIFPAFLLIMGVSLAISLGRRLDRGEQTSGLLRQIFRRTAVIFALGLLSNALNYDPADGLRVMGVLQRIALCYFFSAFFFLAADPLRQSWAAVLLLAGYWALLTRVPVPGAGRGVLTPQGNLASYIDRALLGGHLYEKLDDPEGFLSTIPAIATALMGVLAGQWLRSPRKGGRKAVGLLCAGAVCAALGRFWSFSFPLNKHLWTSSFALLAGGVALCGLAACYWLIEIRDVRRWARPFEIFGRNPLLSYFLSLLFYGVQEFVAVRMPDGSEGNLKLAINARLFGGWLSPPDAALAYAVVYTALIWGLMAALHRKKLYWKI